MKPVTDEELKTALVSARFMRECCETPEDRRDALVLVLAVKRWIIDRRVRRKGVRTAKDARRLERWDNKLEGKP